MYAAYKSQPKKFSPSGLAFEIILAPCLIGCCLAAAGEHYDRTDRRRAAKRVLEAELQVSANTQERIAAREKYLERMIKLDSDGSRWRVSGGR